MGVRVAVWAFHVLSDVHMSGDFAPITGPDTVKVDGRVVILPKIGPVAMVEELRLVGSIREVTINRKAGDR